METFEGSVRFVLENNDCTFIRQGDGEYDIWYCRPSKKYIAVDHSIKSKRHANIIMRLSGVNHQL